MLLPCTTPCTMPPPLRTSSCFFSDDSGNLVRRFPFLLQILSSSWWLQHSCRCHFQYLSSGTRCSGCHWNCSFIMDDSDVVILKYVSKFSDTPSVKRWGSFSLNWAGLDDSLLTDKMQWTWYCVTCEARLEKTTHLLPGSPGMCILELLIST